MWRACSVLGLALRACAISPCTLTTYNGGSLNGLSVDIAAPAAAHPAYTNGNGQGTVSSLSLAGDGGCRARLYCAANCFTSTPNNANNAVQPYDFDIWVPPSGEAVEFKLKTYHKVTLVSTGARVGLQDPTGLLFDVTLPGVVPVHPSTGAPTTAPPVPSTSFPSQAGCTLYTYKSPGFKNGQRDHVGPVSGHPAHTTSAVRGVVSSLRLSGPRGCTARFYCEANCLTHTNLATDTFVEPYSFLFTVGADGEDVLVNLNTDVTVTLTQGNQASGLSNPVGAYMDVTAPHTCPIQLNGSAGFEAGCVCNDFSSDAPSQPWSDRDYRFCKRFPAVLENSYHIACPHCASAGESLSLTCPNNWDACDVFVMAHKSCANNIDGGLHYNLESDGWAPGSCGPDFCFAFEDTCQSPPTDAVVQPGDTHISWRMTLFHKQFVGGDVVSIPELATDPTMYFTFFVREGHPCSPTLSESECLAAPSVCRWDASRADPCYTEICPYKAPGSPEAPKPCADIAPGVETGTCHAHAITRVDEFALPSCA